MKEFILEQLAVLNLTATSEKIAMYAIIGTITLVLAFLANLITKKIILHYVQIFAKKNENQSG